MSEDKRKYAPTATRYNKTHYRDCKRKKRFYSWDEAEKWGKKVGLRAYYCPICDGYHLSSRELRRS